MKDNSMALHHERDKQQTSSAAVLATGAELSRRCYDVTFTIGNTRRVDMLCSAPSGQTSKVQVKGISGAYGFYIDKSFFEGETQPNLFLIVVVVPPVGDNAPFRFFILNHADAKKEFSKMPQHKRDGKPQSNPGLNWGSVKHYQDKWHTFPN
jgi:hypothetical protein